MRLADLDFELILAYDKIQMILDPISLPIKQIGTAVWLPVVFLKVGEYFKIIHSDIKIF